MGNFLVRHASRVVIYDRRAVIRLATVPLVWRFLPIPGPLFFTVRCFQIQFTVNKYGLWLDSNPGPLVSKATALPTVPRQCPKLIFKFVHFIKWDRWESLPPSAQELLDSSSIDCLVYCSHWCVLHCMLARCSRCEVFLLARNAAAYWVKLTRCERDFPPKFWWSQF